MRLLLFILFFIGQFSLAEPHKNESNKSLKCQLAVANDMETEQELKLKGFDVDYIKGLDEVQQKWVAGDIKNKKR